jgi:hypothetical protein
MNNDEDTELLEKEKKEKEVEDFINTEKKDKIVDTEIIDEKQKKENKGEVRTLKPKPTEKKDIGEFKPSETQKPEAKPKVITITDSKEQKVIISGLIDGYVKKEVQRKGKIIKLDGDWVKSEVLVIRLKKE